MLKSTRFFRILHKRSTQNKLKQLQKCFWENKMTKKKPKGHNIGGTSKQKRRKENKG